MKIMKFFTIITVCLILNINLFAQMQEVSPYSPVKPSTSTVDATWDILFSFLTRNAGEQGVESDGQYIYTTRWQTDAYVRRYNTTGTIVDSFTVTGLTAGIRDLAYGGGFFWGGKNTTAIYKVDPTTTPPSMAGQITASGVTGVRHLSFDPAGNAGAGSLWCGPWDALSEISLTGSNLGSAAGIGLTGMYGSAYDGVTPGGPYLWIFNQDQGSSANADNLTNIYQFKISNKTLTGVTHHAEDLPGYVAGAPGAQTIAGGAGSNVGIVAGKLVLLVNVQQSPNLIGAYELAIATGTENNPKIENLVKVYPNPASDLVKVKSGLYVIDQLTITNNIGQVVFEGSNGTNQFQINTSNWEAGLYFVKVQTVEGTKTYKLNIQ